MTEGSSQCTLTLKSYNILIEWLVPKLHWFSLPSGLLVCATLFVGD